MSGPKCYTPPPRYSVNVFDGKLNEIFGLQSRITSLIDELTRLSLMDKERNIQFDCSDFLNANKLLTKQLLNTFTLSYEGTFGQEQYDIFVNQIDQTIDKLTNFSGQIHSEKEAFLNKQADYDSFISYENHYKHSAKSFNTFKNQVIDYLESYLKESYPEILEEAKKAIAPINLNVQMVNFEFGFRNTVSSLKETLVDEIPKCESAINNKRTSISDKIAKDFAVSDIPISSQIDLTKLPNYAGEQQDIKKLLAKIYSFMAQVEDSFSKQEYIDRLNKLVESESLKDVYFYKELLEDIKQSERTRQWKTETKATLTDLNSLKTHSRLKAEKEKLVNLCLGLIEKEQIKPYEMENVQTQLHQFKERNQKQIDEDFTKDKERQFLKAQIIKCLESLNYEVMEDMQVIDFEKESDFLLAIPSQSNYLNLRFNQDGSFLYNFLIPEKKDKLSIDQKKQKLTEMDSTCKGFKKLLKDLESFGLKLNLQKEMPVSERALISVPNKHRAKIRTSKTKRERKRVEKQKYLKK